MLKNFKIDLRLIKEIDKTVVMSTTLLVLYGILNVYMCTKGNYGFYFAKQQFFWFVLSIIALYFFVAIDYTIIFNYVPIFYWGSVILLLAAKIPGIGVVVNGARGWIRVGGFQLQPAELAKLGIILMLAKKLDEMDGEINDIKNFFTLVIYALIPVVFIVTQPDMGMTMVCFFIVLGIFYIAGLDMKIIGGGLLSLVLLIVIVWNSGLIQSYQKQRFTGFLNPEAADATSGYHLTQSLIGIGSGGILGSRPSLKVDGTTGYAAQNVPEVQTDFIFAAIAEQWGLIGAIILLTLYGFLIYKMISIARTSKDIFGSIICVGIISYFLFAIFQNIGMTIGLLPITGITLPLISYGGSSLLTTIMSIALVLNIGMRRKKIHF
ncbi:MULTISPECIES: rod shape-determining protein RodA [Clostridium]|uniref:Rod shape-determining protein RodA n=1 Tax=Clostridium botulinum TaxID=1491 RepID=A0A6B4HTY0_CLOBO|nr:MULTISPECIES: rod shape-determining protein RodA [Clostridium]ACD53201.1 stage V sporulation protein E [Clostridium botulinum E3 str. Alaska E43]AJF28595.1 cell division protein FtsW [Clostridium botulinum]AJF31656.1 cell division protein FtsW [Clostridium botulinum]EES50954.1 stage V sporulation protein E [Clostridium botulinum E1 str. 'BoNT E Beluga']KIL08814.1 cell division protein FtsW [Clostridium botulinum]